MYKRQERTQRAAARFIARDYRTTTPGFVTGLLRKYELPPLQERRERLRLTFLYRVVEGLVPAIPPDQYLVPHKPRLRIREPKKLSDFQTSNIVDNYIRNNNRCFEVPKSATDQHKHSFYPRTILAWNHLDDSIVNSASVETFETSLAKARRQ